MVKPKKKEKQQTLEATLGRPRVRPAIKTPRKGKGKIGTPASSSPARVSSSPRPPPSSFMNSSQVGGSARKKRVILDDDDSSDDRGSAEEEEVELPVRSAKRGRKRGLSASGSGDGAAAEEGQGKGGDGEDGEDEDAEEDDEDDDEEDDDKPLVTPTPRRKRRLVLDESDDGDEPLVSSPVKRRRLVRRNVASSPVNEDKEDEDEVIEMPALSSSRARRTGRRPMTEKEKARERLRRKRAGEVISEEEESSSSEEEEPVKAMYDTDSDNLALNEFEDDDEGVIGTAENGKKTAKKKKSKQKKRKDAEDDDEAEDTDDFIVDDDDEPLGIPADVYLDMPLEFTAHSHKPLKEHFRDAIEWLVQFKVNPGFEKDHQLYRMAWKKLDDEVRGLATSKFASAAWKKDFYMALRARPYFTNGELPKGDLLEARSCGACGRAGHPARHMITFTGSAYYKDTTKLDRFLQPVETNSSDSDSGSDSHDEDEDGNPIPKEAKRWFIGVVCNSNAETAHNLMHWKQALLDWVDTRLHEEGHMAPSALAERERMRPKKRYKLVDEILDRWMKQGVVKALYQDFKGTIEQARNKSTTGRYR